MEFSNFDLLSGTEAYADETLKRATSRRKAECLQSFESCHCGELKNEKAHIILLQGTHGKQISMLRICAEECLK